MSLEIRKYDYRVQTKNQESESCSLLAVWLVSFSLSPGSSLLRGKIKFSEIQQVFIDW